ncbi:MAG: sulfatase, partial [Gimesia sp.]|nr:sulfatase [Gimesia sp.]
MNFDDLMLRDQTRRHFFENCAMGAGAIGLASLMQSEQRAQAGTGKLHGTHHPPKAKNVIYMFMAGGPSQLEMFDFKPKLQELEGKVIPESYVEGKQFAFLKKDAKLLGTRRKFKKHGESGMELSEVVPHLAEVADDITILKSMKTDVFNHGPAKLFMNTGTQQFGRPSMGAWVTYGIGSESQNLPGFVVLQSGPRGPRGGAPLWGSGFLPTTYQGVPFLNGADPILNLSSPSGINSVRQSEFIDTVNQLNSLRLEKTRDPEIATRISA